MKTVYDYVVRMSKTLISIDYRCAQENFSLLYCVLKIIIMLESVVLVLGKMLHNMRLTNLVDESYRSKDSATYH